MKRELKQWIRPDCRPQPENEPETEVPETDIDEQKQDNDETKESV